MLRLKRRFSGIKRRFISAKRRFISLKGRFNFTKGPIVLLSRAMLIRKTRKNIVTH